MTRITKNPVAWLKYYNFCAFQKFYALIHLLVTHKINWIIQLLLCQCKINENKFNIVSIMACDTRNTTNQWGKGQWGATNLFHCKKPRNQCLKNYQLLAIQILLIFLWLYVRTVHQHQDCFKTVISYSIVANTSPYGPVSIVLWEYWWLWTFLHQIWRKTENAGSCGLIKTK